MSLFEVSVALETSDHLHLGRLLVLLGTFAGDRGTGTIDGLTKLAKLDFLLRYPNYLEKALVARSASPEAANVKQYERSSVESAMVRYRYGPWDFRYRRFVNMLVGKGLARIQIEGRTTRIGLTSRGLSLANLLAENEAFTDTAERSKLLRRHFDIGATSLARFIYATFPEITTLRLGEEIRY